MFLSTLILGTEEGPQDSVHVVARPLDHADRAVKCSLAAFGNLKDEELKQRVADVGAQDPLNQHPQVAAVPIGIQRQEVAVGVRFVYDPGDVDFLGLAHGSPPFCWQGSDEPDGRERLGLRTGDEAADGSHLTAVIQCAVV